MKYIWRIVTLFLWMILLFTIITVTELSTDKRILPWYCGGASAKTLPPTVRIGFYEEFPNAWRLEKLRQLDFPVKLAVPAGSQTEFKQLRDHILREYSQVREVYYWPLLSYEEGYYPGVWASADGIKRISAEAEGLPVLWDLEIPPPFAVASQESVGENRKFLDQWFRQRSLSNQPVHIWRSHSSLGVDSWRLKLLGMHFDPHDYQAVSLHLDLYKKGVPLSTDEMQLIIECGVNTYHDRFIPSMGVLNDGEGTNQDFISPLQLRRDLQIARNAGVAEIWLFGVNGINAEYIAAIHETVPLESLPAGGK